MLIAFSLRFSTQKRRVQCLFGHETITEAHFVRAGSITPVASIWFISYFSNSLASGPARHEPGWTGQFSLFFSSIRGCPTLFEPSCCFQVPSTWVSMLINSWLYDNYSFGSVRSLGQSVFNISLDFYSIVVLHLIIAALNDIYDRIGIPFWGIGSVSGPSLPVWWLIIFRLYNRCLSTWHIGDDHKLRDVTRFSRHIWYKDVKWLTMRNVH